MTTFIKTKFKITDDQTNIDEYRLAANITVYHIISKLILQRIIITNFCGPVNHLRWSTISDLESPSNFQIKEEEKLFKSVRKQGNWAFVVQTVIWRKYNIKFWIPIKFWSQRKKNIQIGPETTKLDFCGPGSHLGKVQYRIWNPH